MDRDFIPLEALFVTRRPANSLVALKPDSQVCTWSDWHQQVSNAAFQLQTQQGKSCAIYSECAYQFSVMFFAALAADKNIVLPGNKLSSTISQLPSVTDLLIGELDEQHSFESLIENTKRPLVNLQLNTSLQVSIFTSGSSGLPDLIEKTFRQLSHEVATLNKIWGQDLAGAEVAATVSHQHIYGLLFRVLLPLTGGNAFHSQICAYSESLYQKIAQAAESGITIISSPSHLSRLPAVEQVLNSAATITRIFSSTAPLSYDSARSTEAITGILPTEVFGSSETGGIAHRQQSQVDMPWTIMPGISYLVDKEQQNLMIKSPHLPNKELYKTQDRVEFINPQQFHLKGRIDNIFKVEGKRLSSTEMEANLARHPTIRSAKLIQTSAGQRLIAFIELNLLGLEQLKNSSKRDVSESIRKHLLAQFELVVIPRRYRYVNKMPTDLQGKTTATLLEALAGASPAERRYPNVVLFNQLSELDWELELAVPKHLSFFTGHFKQHPILPGVVLVMWAQHYANLLFSIEVSSASLHRLKFQQIVLPETEVTLSLKHKPEHQQLEFRFQSERGSHASGRFSLERQKP